MSFVCRLYVQRKTAEVFRGKRRRLPSETGAFTIFLGSADPETHAPGSCFIQTDGVEFNTKMTQSTFL